MNNSLLYSGKYQQRFHLLQHAVKWIFCKDVYVFITNKVGQEHRIYEKRVEQCDRNAQFLN